MGQAFIVVNLDKKQYLHPHEFGDGYKLIELSDVLSGLAILLANSDDHPWADAPHFGEWSGDRIVVMGEYSAAYDDMRGTYEQVGSDLARYLKDQ